MPTPGYKTKAFWLVAAATLLAAVQGTGAADVPGLSWLGDGLAAVLSALGAAGYASVRAFEKGGFEDNPWWKRTEFWLAAATAVAMLATLGAPAESWVYKLAAGALAISGYAFRHDLPPKAP